jgi:hydrogenase/urease accessory protein HupE
MAVVAWLAMLSLTGLGLLLLLPYRPRLALAMPLLGALLAGISAIG